MTETMKGSTICRMPSTRLHHPFRFVEFADDGDLAERRGLLQNGAHGIIASRFHGVPCGLRFPTSDGEQRTGISELPMQSGASGARRPLKNFTHPYPRGGVLLGGMTRFYVNLEEVFHRDVLK